MSCSSNYKLSTQYCCYIESRRKDEFKPYTVIFVDFIVHDTSMLTVAVYNVDLMHSSMYDFILSDLQFDQNSV